MTPRIVKINSGNRRRPPSRKRLRQEETKRLRNDALSDSSEGEAEVKASKAYSYDDDDELDIPYAIRDDQNQALQLSCILSETKKEPLRPGDVIVYPPPLRISGFSDQPRLGQVVSTELPHIVTLDNGDVLLSGDVVVRRWMEYRSQQWYPHDGIARPLGQFRMRQDKGQSIPRLPPELRKRLERKLLPSKPNEQLKSNQQKKQKIEKNDEIYKDDASRERDASESDDSSTASSSSSELSTLLQEAMDSASKCRMLPAMEEDASIDFTPLKVPPQRLSLSKQNHSQGSTKVPTPSAVNNRIGLPTSEDDEEDLFRPIDLKRTGDNKSSAGRPPKYPIPSCLIQGSTTTNPLKKKGGEAPSAHSDDDDDDILRPQGFRNAKSPSFPPLQSHHAPSPPGRPTIKSFFLHRSPPRASALPNRTAQIEEFQSLVRRHRELGSPSRTRFT
jgi:hypothetical protein